MRQGIGSTTIYQEPALLSQAQELIEYIQSLSTEVLASSMHLSGKKAIETWQRMKYWSVEPDVNLPAIDAFLGDIYSGLQTQSFDQSDRDYANTHLLILSGLYGGLRALDSVAPYRLEMGYRLPDERYRNLYKFWGDRIARLLPVETSLIVNLSAVEYTKVILPHVAAPVVTPKFLTENSKTNKPTFVVVHAKIARGAFAHWLVTKRINDPARLVDFMELGYRYDAALSTPEEPVFVCREFGGLGLSVRLT